LSIYQKILEIINRLKEMERTGKVKVEPSLIELHEIFLDENNIEHNLKNSS